MELGFPLGPEERQVFQCYSSQLDIEEEVTNEDSLHQCSSRFLSL